MTAFEISLNRIAKARKACGDSGARSAAEIAADDRAPPPASAPVTRSTANGSTGGSGDGGGNRAGDGQTKGTQQKKNSQFLDVHYQPLCDEPLREVERIYSHFGMELTVQARKNMEDWIANVSQPRRTMILLVK